MSQANMMDGSSVLDFEWNVFEQMQQALNWCTLPSENHVPSGASSPEDISYFTADPNTMILPNYAPQDSQGEPRVSKKSSSSRARRQSQNREAQRAFRIRQRQRFEELESELHSLRSKYESLQEKYASLNLLYMEHVNFAGSLWSPGSTESTECARSAVSEGGVPRSFQVKGNGSIKTLELQQSDVAAWLAATGQVKTNEYRARQ